MASVQCTATTTLPTRYGVFRLAIYAGIEHLEQVVLSVGSIDDGHPVLVRLHSECLTGDILGSARCDCGEQLDRSLKLIQQEGRGVLIYLRQEGRGIGLTNKIRAYALQEQGLDTVEANLALGLPDDCRTYVDAAAILTELGIHQVRLLTNNPSKIESLTRYGIAVVERVPLHIAPNPTNEGYIRTKQERMGHLRPESEELEIGILYRLHADAASKTH